MHHEVCWFIQRSKMGEKRKPNMSSLRNERASIFSKGCSIPRYRRKTYAEHMRHVGERSTLSLSLGNCHLARRVRPDKPS